MNVVYEHWVPTQISIYTDIHLHRNQYLTFTKSTSETWWTWWKNYFMQLRIFVRPSKQRLLGGIIPLWLKMRKDNAFPPNPTSFSSAREEIQPWFKILDISIRKGSLQVKDSGVQRSQTSKLKIWPPTMHNAVSFYRNQLLLTPQ